MLERALQGARLLYAYTMYIVAPLETVFHFTGDPASWAKDYEGEPIPKLKLKWEGSPYRAGSIMALTPLRKDETETTAGLVRMELIHYEENVELAFRYLNGNHLIYRFAYSAAGDGRTEFTVNVLLDAQSPPLNTLRQRLYARRRRKASVADHLKVKAALEQIARRK